MLDFYFLYIFFTYSHVLQVWKKMERMAIGIRDTGDHLSGRHPAPKTRTTSPTRMRHRPRRPRRRVATSGDVLP